MKLYYAIDEILKKYNHTKIVDVINNKEESAKYVRDVLEKNYSLPTTDISIKNLSNELGNRVNHILFTFSLGLLVADFCGLKGKIIETYKRYCYYNNKLIYYLNKADEERVFINVWLIISLYHDYGYFFMKNSNINSFDDIYVYKS